MRLRKFIPKSILLHIKVLMRNIRDIKNPQKFSKNKSTDLNHEFSLSIQQEIKKNEYFENKIENIKLGIQNLDQLLIAPGEVFSFWKLIPKPNANNGFKLSRNIIDGKLKEDYGGGLCQLSSIIYHCALISGLTIVERHNHSVDLYREEDRFTPLGSDATIVYGYKDLRIQNPFTFSLKISFHQDQNTLSCHFSSPYEIKKQEIAFDCIHLDEKVEVATYNKTEDKMVLLNKASYLKLK